MRVIHLLRKPLSEGNTAANVLRHGCGALNVEATRIHTTENLIGGAYSESSTPRAGQDMWSSNRKTNTRVFQRGKEHTGEFQQPTGRWPANLILGHKPDCRMTGVKRVKGGNDPRGKDGSIHAGIWSYGERPRVPISSTGYSDADGRETVDAWECEPGCPVVDIDAQGRACGVHSAGSAHHSLIHNEYEPSSYSMGWNRSLVRFGDDGGASRFFKQVGGLKKG